jgi:hypothetical protein
MTSLGRGGVSTFEVSIFLGVFPPVIAGWDPTLRTVVLMSVCIGAVVALAIYLAPRTEWNARHSPRSAVRGAVVAPLSRCSVGTSHLDSP